MATINEKTYQFVEYLWDDAVAARLAPLDLLVYRSNILGSDDRITHKAV